MRETELLADRLQKDGAISNLAIRVGKFGDRIGEVYSDGVNSQTLFDLASVTKIMATTTLVLIAVEQKRLDITDKVSKFFAVPEWYKDLTVFNLLTHTMGLGSRDLTGNGNTYDTIAERILSIKGTAVGKWVEDSCPAFILLGKILEKIYGERLDALFRNMVAAPLGLKSSGFLPDKAKHSIVNSNIDENKRGIVNDYNCQFLGGVAGNAGLFSNMDDLTVYADMLLSGGGKLFSRSDLDMASRNYTAGMVQARGLGFWVVDENYRQTGTLFPPGSIGHCGHTGVSLFLNRESGLYVIILSDATISTVRKYGKENYDEVMQMREKLHHAIWNDLWNQGWKSC